MIASGARGAQPASGRPAESSADERSVRAEVAGGEGGAVGHTDPWQALAEASTAELLCAAWLDLLCSTLVPAEAGMVLLAQPDGAFAPVVARPEGSELLHLREVATEALSSRLSTQRVGDGGRTQVAYPLVSGDQLHGAVVLELPPGQQDAVAALQQVQWGAGWLLGLLHQRDLSAQRRRLHEGGFLLDALLGLLADRTLREAALALVNRLGQEFDSPQVHLALLRGRTLRLVALSHAAWFEERAGLMRRALDAMHETLDQRRLVAWPAAEDAPVVIDAAHRRYAEDAQASALVSLPLVHDGEPLGVLLLEMRGRPDRARLAYLETLALGLAPAIASAQDARQGVWARLRRSFAQARVLVFGPRYPAAKLAAATVGGLLLLLALIPIPFRIAAPATVEGKVQRSAVAPFEGYLREAPARAGDRVRAGDVLARLDDRDLRLERTRWEAELEVAQRKEREAMAAGNAADQRLAAAQANQARAQLDLALSRLERVSVTAPFDGIVVRGDLSQQLGSPVEQGKVLFELAPLDEWRVILKVDERDIGYVQIGARGVLLLASLPGQRWPFTVRKLTPVSVAQDGSNHFRVEAELDAGTPSLTPNMEGVGKVRIGSASPLWIWTRRLVDWWRLAWWKILP
jgi:biotin carboxyl carrier protein